MKILLLGYGKMNQLIDKLLKQEGDETFIYDPIVKPESSKILQDRNLLEQIDVAIDFTTPDSVVENINFLIEQGINGVIGTTGWSKAFERINQEATEKKVGIIYASNFSIGVNIFFQLLQKSQEIFSKFPDYKASISETHHQHKLDKPSGTALSIEEIIQSNSEIESIREGEVVGIHEVKYASTNDEIKLIHNAKDREGFAKGAIYAAKFIKQHPNLYGLINFADILNSPS